MSYFTTHLSLNLLVKEFLRKVNTWQSYSQNGDCFVCHIRIALWSSKILFSPDKLNKIDASLLSTNIEFAFSALICLQCFDAVGWAAGRASGL